MEYRNSGCLRSRMFPSYTGCSSTSASELDPAYQISTIFVLASTGLANKLASTEAKPDLASSVRHHFVGMCLREGCIAPAREHVNPLRMWILGDRRCLETAGAGGWAETAKRATGAVEGNEVCVAETGQEGLTEEYSAAATTGRSRSCYVQVLRQQMAAFLDGMTVEGSCHPSNWRMPTSIRPAYHHRSFLHLSNTL